MCFNDGRVNTSFEERRCSDILMDFSLKGGLRFWGVSMVGQHSGSGLGCIRCMAGGPRLQGELISAVPNC